MKFSIVTPAWEVAKWLPETIESVLSQRGDFTIEYIIVADKSSDRTVETAKEYEQKVASGAYPVVCNKITMKVIEPETAEGMYVALNKGFAAASGDIFAWIAGDDVYQSGAFAIAAKCFETYPDIEWLKGKTATIGEHSERLRGGATRIYHRDWLRLGVYGMESYHVEQDSTFWRKELWHKVAPFPSSFKSSGDYWLWIQMARFAPLWSVDAPFSCFRKREGQDSRVNATRLLAQKAQARGPRPLGAWIPRLFFWPYMNLSKNLHPLLDALYPVLFFYKSRTYLSAEEDAIVKRTMPTFYIT
jgi:glycosyltransferase involved in cell wall biosynthesis